MKSKIIVAVIAAAWLLGPTAQAAEFTPALNARSVIDLDTPDDSISLWEQDDLAGITALRSEVTVRRVGKPKSIKPGLFLILSNDMGSVSFILLASPKGSMMALESKRGGAVTGGEAFFSVIDPQETFGLEIDWTTAGRVEVRITSKTIKAMGGDGFERHTISLDGAPTKIEIYGMAGEVEFKPLTLGSVR